MENETAEYWKNNVTAKNLFVGGGVGLKLKLK